MNAGAAAMATGSAKDAELVEAVRIGEGSAFEELFRRYRPRVHAFVLRRVRDEGRAEELTQEAFLSALRRLRETETPVNFRPWIYEIARNTTIDHFRRRSRADEVSVDAVDRLRPAEHLRLVDDPGPHREVAAKEDLETLRGAFDELSERHEQILVARELEGLSYREIGERMALTRPGVESTLFRARRRLEAEFAALETGRRCAAVRGAIGRLAEGMDLRGDRGLVKRHTRRCPRCRATGTELGVLPARPSRAARAAVAPGRAVATPARSPAATSTTARLAAPAGAALEAPPSNAAPSAPGAPAGSRPPEAASQPTVGGSTPVPAPAQAVLGTAPRAPAGQGGPPPGGVPDPPQAPALPEAPPAPQLTLPPAP